MRDNYSNSIFFLSAGEQRSLPIGSNQLCAGVVFDKFESEVTVEAAILSCRNPCDGQHPCIRSEAQVDKLYVR